MAAVIGRSPATALVNITLLLSLFFYCINTRVRKSWVFFVVYSFIAFLIGFTILVHPEYSSWYTHSQYGITKQFLDLGSSIWAFLIIGLYEDEERLLHDLKIIAALVFLAYMTKFFGAMQRGYWILGTSGRHASYDMEFGFRILFATVFWGALGLYKNKKYLILYFVGIIIILMGGSRASFIWALLLFIANIPFMYAGSSVRKKRLAIISSILSIPFIVTFFRYSKQIVKLTASGLRLLGLSSRTIGFMSRGALMEENGRDIIFRMAIDLIKTGGPFGHGFYGDRLYIGQRFYWGYSHNIFLELLVTFGYVGGSVLIIALIVGCYKLYQKSYTSTKKVIFLTFFVNSFKLFLSNSFWYESSFWALLALMFFWERKKTNTEIQSS